MISNQSRFQGIPSQKSSWKTGANACMVFISPLHLLRSHPSLEQVVTLPGLLGDRRQILG